MTKVARWFLGFSFAFVLYPIGPAYANVVFGPKIYRGEPRGTHSSDNFAAKPNNGPFVLTVINGKGDDLAIDDCRRCPILRKIACHFKNLLNKYRVSRDRASDVEIRLNGDLVLSSRQLKPDTPRASVPVRLLAKNKLEVLIKGSKTSFISLKIDDSQTTFPTASFTYKTDPARGGLTLDFDGSASSVTKGKIVSYHWKFGDGSFGEGQKTVHTYSSGGTYDVTLTVTDQKGDEASKTQTVTIAEPPVVSLKTVSASQGIAPFTALFDSSGTKDPLGLSLTYLWDFGDGQSSTLSGQVPHEFLETGSYTVTLTVTNSAHLSAKTQVSITTTNPVIPVLPAAPPVPPNGITPFSQLTDFIYNGPGAVQTGIQSGAIVPDRAAVLRGRVLDQNENPLSGVEVSFIASQFGHTYTRADGQFDIVVNGGGTVKISFQRNGYLPAQRSLQTGFNNYFILPDVELTRPDPNVTLVKLGAAAPQLAKGSPQTDSSGTRTAVAMLPSNTTASLLLPSGQTLSMSQLSLRATEFTVGPNGPKRMPASLPATSVYTYAVELSSDEGRALGASHIQFSKPVSFYVDNFLGFSAGTIVPIGSYNRDTGFWDPESNGRVIKVLAVTNGVASLDVTGSGAAASAQDLSALGISSEELAQIGSLYAVGTSFWRLQTDHFSILDLNFADDRKDLNLAQREPHTPDDPQEPQCKLTGSIIDPFTQTLGEEIPLVGIPFTLNYSTARAAGRDANRSVWIPLTPDNTSLPPELLGETLTVNVAGQTFTQDFPAQQNLLGFYKWNGNDAYGRPLNSTQMASVEIQYHTSGSYSATSASSLTDPNINLFGLINFLGTSGNSVSTRADGTVTETYQVPLGSVLSQDGLAGWRFNIHHFYDPNAQILYFGDGTKMSSHAQIVFRRISTIAGDGTLNVGGIGGPAIDATIGEVLAPYVSPAGNILFDSAGKIFRIDGSTGIFTWIAGNGLGGYSGDGGPATSAAIAPAGISMVEGSDRSIYFADILNHVIRKIDPNGIITTIAGTGVAGYSGDGGPATAAQLNLPRSLAFIGETLYFVDAGNHVIRAITGNGIVLTIGGNGTNTGDGEPASQALFNSNALVATPDGGLYIADNNNNRIKKISRDGTVSTFAGTGQRGEAGDGGPATEAELDTPQDLALAPDGSLYIVEFSNKIRVVTPDGLISTFAGTGEAGYSGDGGNPASATFNTISGIALTPDGSLIVGDRNNHRLRKISNPFPAIQNDTYTFPSENGKEIFVFALNGLHLKTLNAVTGALKWQFGYDAQGNLTSVTDGDGNVVQISRDASGQPVAITSAYGQVTNLSVGSDGSLNTVTNPNGESYNMQYAAGGMLSQFTKPNGASSSFTYDALGLLQKDQDALGGFTELNRIDLPTGTLFPKLTAEGRSSQITYIKNGFQGGEISDFVDGAGASTKVTNIGMSSMTTAPSQATHNRTLASDPRLGLPATFVSFDQTLMGSTVNDSTTVSRNTQLSLTDPFAYQTTDTISRNGNVSTQIYDGATRTYRATSAVGRVSQQTIDPQGRIVQSQSGNLTPTIMTYDPRGKLTEIQQGSRTTGMTYDNLGQLASVTDSLGQTTTYSYDRASRVTGVKLADGREIAYSYDSSGNVASVTPPGRPTHNLLYNLLDLLNLYTPPDVGSGTTTTQYTYNLDRQLKSVVRPDGQSIQYGYDSVTPRLTSITTPSGNYGFFYFADGRLNVAQSPDGIQTYFGYNADLVTTLNQVGPVASSVSFSYDNNQNISSIAVRSANVNYAYDADNLLTAVGPLSLQRDAQNGLVTGTSLSSLSEGLSYNSFGEMMSDQVGSLFTMSLVRDDLGRITSKSEIVNGSSANFDYSYDSTGRLVAVNQNGVLKSSYSYDSNSNRISASIGGASISATVDTQDRLLTYGSNSYTYNANGDLASKTNASGTTKYNYDVFGNLKSVTLPNATVITYLMDAQNQRVVKKVSGVVTQSFIYDTSRRILAELNTSGNPISIFGYGTKGNTPDLMIKNGVNYKIISDQVGSVRLIVNASTGQVAQQIDYDEFGQVLNDTNPGFQPFGFAGGLYDRDTKLVRFGARDYDPETGRWTSKDPILFNGGDTNLYGHVLNDPVNFIDPSGLDATNWWNTDGGRNPITDGPTNGNWGGGRWSGGKGGGGTGNATPLDSGDDCYMAHDKCYDSCGRTKDCDQDLRNCLKRLPNDPRSWPRPPRSGTEGDSSQYRDGALLLFRGYGQ